MVATGEHFTSVPDYYGRIGGRIGSRIGYALVMGRSQHFGYYDTDTPGEAHAQVQYHQEFAELLDPQPGMRVLDAGSGQGVVATYLAKHHNVDVNGITVVPHEVTNATRLAHKLGVEEQAHFQLADYTNPPFPNEQFDRVYTTETLSHATDLPATLESFHRVLKTGGKIALAEYEIDYANISPELRSVYDFWETSGSLHGLKEFDKGKFPQSLAEVGFTNVAEHDWTKAVAPSFARIYRMAHPLDTVVRKVGAERHFVNTVAAKGYHLGVVEGGFKYKVYTADKAA